jgi:hypothetical protein
MTQGFDNKADDGFNDVESILDDLKSYVSKF